MYENKTADAIRAQILSNTPSTVSTMEGSFASDMAAAVSLEIAKAYGELDRTLEVMFVDGAEAQDLERRAGEYGITRKPGALATGAITITGDSGTVIPAGTAAMTEDGLRYLTDEAVTLTGGTASVAVTAAAVGAAYNVGAGQVTRLYRNIVGVDTVSNGATLAGGVDTETDDALRARLLARMRTPATSGNVHHYKQWALEVPGVGAAKVTPLWDGPGTVRVLIVGNDREPVGNEIVTACAAYIEDNRPIGADVTVISAGAENISVAATVTLAAGAVLAEVQAAYQAALEKYLQSIAFVDYLVSYNRVAYLLMDVEGVLDYSELTLNGGTVSISISADDVPVLTGVTLDAV